MTIPKLDAQPGFREKWKHLSDEEILATNFVVADPESLDGLMRLVPTGDEIPSVEFQYHTKSGKENYVYCAHCEAPTHNKGYVLIYSNGSRILVGNVCGKKIYGLDFSRAVNDFSSAMQRANIIQRRNNLIDQETLFLKQLNELLRHPTIPIFEQMRRDFNNTFSGVSNMLHNAAVRSNGQLFITEKVRDFDAEIREEEKLERQKEERMKLSKAKRKAQVYYGEYPSSKSKAKPIFKEVLKPIGRVASLLWVAPMDPISNTMQVLFNRAKHFFVQLKEESSTPKLLALVRNFEQIIDELEKLSLRLREPISTFEPRNLEVLRSWSAHQLSGADRILIDGKALVRYNAYSDTISRCAMAKDYAPPNVQFLADIRAVAKIAVNRDKMREAGIQL